MFTATVTKEYEHTISLCSTEKSSAWITVIRWEKHHNSTHKTPLNESKKESLNIFSVCCVISGIAMIAWCNVFVTDLVVAVGVAMHFGAIWHELEFCAITERIIKVFVTNLYLGESSIYIL